MTSGAAMMAVGVYLMLFADSVEIEWLNIAGAILATAGFYWMGHCEDDIKDRLGKIFLLEAEKMKKYVIVLEPREEPRKKLWLPEYGLSQLQEICGGYIETVPTEREEFLLVVNEEGKIERLPFNRAASKILPGWMRDAICGTAVLMKRGPEDLEPLSAEEAERWIEIIGMGRI